MEEEVGWMTMKIYCGPEKEGSLTEKPRKTVAVDHFIQTVVFQDILKTQI